MDIPGTDYSRTYYDLLEALPKPDCVVCRLVDEAVRQHIDMFVYENITNLARREEIRLAHGYCSIHTTIFMNGYGRLLSLATVEQDILNDVQRRINHATSNPAKGGSLVGALLHTLRNAIRGALLPSRPCPLCDYERSHEKVILGTLIQFIDDPAMAAAFESAGLLCLPHYYVALGMRGIPGISGKLDKVIAREQQGLKQLKADVDEYVRKRNTLYQDEEMIQEADAPTRAAKVIGGRIVHSDGRW
jgi:Family of unknown function (DUF6062)